jgi:hypothetical protein
VTLAKTRPVICCKQWELDIRARLEKVDVSTMI